MTRAGPRLAAALATALLTAALPTVARASQTQESFFQDDNHLIYASTSTVNHVLGVLHSFGVDRLRVTILWKALAPNPSSRTRPSHFNASNPAAYPAGNWVPYDRLIELAARYGMGLDFNLTAPGPLWAMRHDAPTARSADHFAPSVKAFGEFVTAVGTRYSGSYTPPQHGSASTPSGSTSTLALPPIPGLPGPSPAPTPAPKPTAIPPVRYWSIWNEPNIPGWLAPQSRTVAHTEVENSPRLYRQYVDVAYQALGATGHRVPTDTILIGELAPEGYPFLGWYTELPPLRFLRALYCLDGRYRPLSGGHASALGCPARPNRSAFVAQHPGLFQATGFSHHPYYFYFAPSVHSANPDFVPLADLGRLERALDRTYASFGVHRRIPIQLTEYGFQTNPPDPYETVTPSQQAAYINQADYMAWRDPRVRSVAQFLLYDDNPDARFSSSAFGYWDTFQTGLLFSRGTQKPAFAAYRMPIWLPSRRVSRGGRLLVWGQLRAAPDSSAQQAQLQWRPPGGSYRTIATVNVPASATEGYFTARVRPPGSGALRIVWGALASRAVSISVG